MSVLRYRPILMNAGWEKATNLNYWLKGLGARSASLLPALRVRAI